ncbi:MAG: division/cell wall cluster transcriptional repressor MraZ [Desulfobacca sp. 4484_104]|nr:MAG: division/cell wall cluster transcriptional repressor MraZ [Desulfobacca sp. 4484_104]
MFRGSYFHVIDDKGRISIPQRYREILQGRQDNYLIVTNLDGYLLAFPLSEWEVIEQRLGQLALLRKDFRSFQRFFVSGAAECQLDRQGRILIPPHLREYARLEKETVLAGAVRCFEIWNRQAFEEDRARVDEMDTEEVRKELGIL